jgi:hypothetical protein
MRFFRLSQPWTWPNTRDHEPTPPETFVFIPGTAVHACDAALGGYTCLRSTTPTG